MVPTLSASKVLVMSSAAFSKSAAEQPQMPATVSGV